MTNNFVTIWPSISSRGSPLLQEICLSVSFLTKVPELERAGLIVQRLLKDRDPADVAREEAELAEAQALVATAESDLVLAKLALDDMAIKAPFAGSIASIEVDLGEEVSTETIVVRLADNSAWRLESDDLDELSV